ncbi:hypothetical protein WG66_003770 [Moniliophthora roreri]|nr:hypothetical protein WG66_003770 [Moniliophthora roreri]
MCFQSYSFRISGSILITHPLAEESARQMERALTNEEQQLLHTCLTNGRLGDSLRYASYCLFFFDYVLTVHKEAAFFWWPGRVTLSTVSFLIARYGAVACIAVAFLPTKSATLDSVNLILRLITIVSSEFIVAVRTWAIWGKNRKILFILAGFTLAALIPAAAIIGIGISTNKVEPLVTPELIDICNVTIGDMPQAFVIPYIVTILYEAGKPFTLVLSLIRIAKWRKTIPESMRAPLLDTLWRDGVMYFSFMLGISDDHLSRSYLVIQFCSSRFLEYRNRIAIKGPSATKRCSGSSSRATQYDVYKNCNGLKNPRDITNPSCSVYNTDTGVEFTTQISIDGSERLPVSSRLTGEDGAEEFG